MKKSLLVLSLAANIVALVVVLFVVNHYGGFAKTIERFTQKSVDTYVADRIDQINSLGIKEGSIVFVGDSLTDRGEWQDMFPSVSIHNRGINGDTTDGVLSRIAGIAKGKPKKIFLLVGVNDLDQGKSVESIVKNTEMIIQRIQSHSVGTQIYLQSLLPINPDLSNAQVKNEDIVKVNEKLIVLSQAYNINYIDISKALTVSGILNLADTSDGVHLNGKGYREWAAKLQKYVNE